MYVSLYAGLAQCTVPIALWRQNLTQYLKKYWYLLFKDLYILLGTNIILEISIWHVNHSVLPAKIRHYAYSHDTGNNLAAMAMSKT